MYISVGNGCNMAYQINRHKGKKETLFFDWVVVNFNSVIKVLNKHDSIDEILHADAIKKIGEGESKSLVSVETLDLFHAPHDISIDFSKEEVEQFIAKYKRRLARIIKMIEGKDKIFFCRAAKEAILKNQKKEFISAVRSINEGCDFTLVSVNYEQETNALTKEDFFLEINLDCRTEGKNIANAWATNHMDWAGVFRQIEKFG